MQTKIETINKDVILFDGVCNLCNGFVQFVIKRDLNDRFRFAPLQSEIGKELLKENPRLAEEMRSIVLVSKGKIYVKSEAALRVTRKLKGGWKLTSIFFAIPRFIRNYVYDISAHNRYRWFGQRRECMVPTKKLQSKFLK